MIRVKGTDEVEDFINGWRTTTHKYNESREIRARKEKSPEQRKSNAKIYLMTEFVRNTFPDVEVETDYKNATVWLDSGALVSWDMHNEKFSWDKEVIRISGLTIDKSKAEEHATRK